MSLFKYLIALLFLCSCNRASPKKTVKEESKIHIDTYYIDPNDTMAGKEWRPKNTDSTDYKSY